MIEHTFKAMGSPCKFLVATDDEWTAGVGIARAEEEVRRIESKYSLFLPTSFLSEINRHAGEGLGIEVDSETADLLDFCAACHKASGGLFDITTGLLRAAYDFRGHQPHGNTDLPSLLLRTGFHHLVWRRPRLDFMIPGMSLDFGGVCKEYAVDRACTIFSDLGIEAALVDLGGDIATTGAPPNLNGWNISVRNPSSPDGYLSDMCLTGGAVATSGDYENFVMIGGRRHCHIIHPRTGIPCYGLVSVTVVSENCMGAGAATTIAMLKEENAFSWLEKQRFYYLAIGADGRQVNILPSAVR